MRNRSLYLVVTVLSVLVSTSKVKADTVPYFDTVAGSSSGEFAWDHFSGSYGDSHSPDTAITGLGSATLTPSPDGGLITGTANLYSFNSVPTWNFHLTGADDSLDYTSIALQFASNVALESSAFQLNGLTPDEFVAFGVRGSSGYSFYWAEWQGVTSESDYSIAVHGGGVHEAVSGAQLTYFNTESAFDITAVPEPNSSMLLIGLAVSAMLRRRDKTRLNRSASCKLDFGNDEFC